MNEDLKNKTKKKNNRHDTETVGRDEPAESFMNSVEAVLPGFQGFSIK